MTPSNFLLGAFSLSILRCILLLFGVQATCVTVLEMRQEANATAPTNVTSKAGLAWPNGATVSLTQFEGTGRVTYMVRLYYTWSTYPIDNDIEFVPMFWGNRSISEWTNTAKRTLADMTPKVTAVLGMNEPELPSQANLFVDEGVELWKLYVELLRAQGYRLGSPGLSSSSAGKAWLQDFISSCNGCTVDFISLHWYGTNVTLFQKHVEDYYTTFQKPLWVTEWACEDYVHPENICTLQDIITFMNAMQTFLDGAGFVERYAWFGAQKNLTMVDSNNGIMDDNGVINDLGKQYINYTESVDEPIVTSLPTFTSGGLRSIPSVLLHMTSMIVLLSSVLSC
ncbi:glycoside hydrolase [Pholiota conissans]|uniref:Glycoside hydrolase n=1 Tax=Pholiota conissans TaxID=109636 RepID=A0A9P5YRW2_9AGAR|nr:glycoside hydrolase [Pholiota conissans]